MAYGSIDLTTLRGMADSLTDLDLSDADLERIAPYVEQYLAGMRAVAHIDLSSIEPESLDPATFVS